MLYAASTQGFYDLALHRDIPADAVEITAAAYGALMEAQHAGQMIQADTDGRPVAVDRPAPTADEQTSIIRAERDRRIAATDYLFTLDYPLPADKSTLFEAYRKSLRDLPAQEGFPWGGDVEVVPWPEKPTLDS